MRIFNTQKYPLRAQFMASIGLVVVVALACQLASDLMGYRVVALVMLMAVSVIAMLFEILPVLTAAVLSAVIWNFFFIPPLYTFRISNTEDLLMFCLYFIVSLVNAVLTFKIRAAEKKARDKEEKENTIKLYNTLLNSLSHELRTPISTILGSVDTLMENDAKLSPAQREALLGNVIQASVWLNRQVENLLNMSRLESGMLKPKYDWCDLSELVHGVIHKIGPEYKQKVVFQADDPLPLFRIDGGLCEQILQNLLYNALQNTPGSSRIDIQARYQDSCCILTVSDNGPGFPLAEIAHVFEKFHRLPNSRPGGTGLGLSIVQGFAEAQNGKVSLENKPEGGAHFRVEIPAATTFINHLNHD